MASCGETASPRIVQMLLEKHEEMDYPIASVDVGGNSPIHVAIKSKAPLGVLQAFKTVFGEFPFQPDREDKSPLRIALLMKDKDPDVICFIAQSCPKAAKLQMYDGKQPAVFAAARNYPDKVVKQLLLCDMPIHFGGQSQTGVNDVILRTHSYSWWNIATKYPKYGSVLNDILTNSANLHEVVALAQESDSQGFGCLFESTFGDVKTVFKNNLVFGERYEVIATFRAIVRNGLLKVCALDWGDGIAWEELAATEGSLPQLMNDGYTTVNTVGNGTEVVYYSKPQREVLLHCCAKDSDQYQELLEEMDARKKFNFSHIDCQRLYNVHTFDGKRIGCTGPMLCLSFERPLLTLQDVSIIHFTSYFPCINFAGIVANHSNCLLCSNNIPIANCKSGIRDITIPQEEKFTVGTKDLESFEEAGPSLTIFPQCRLRAWLRRNKLNRKVCWQ